MPLDEQIVAIEDALGTLLADTMPVNGIVIGYELVSGSMTPPYLQVFLDTSDVDNRTFSGNEGWRLRFSIMAVAPTYKRQDARLARSLALQASELVLANPTLNGLVKDTIRLGWQPDGTKELPSKETLFGSIVSFESRFYYRKE
jgi:hypothetical protein